MRTSKKERKSNGTKQDKICLICRNKISSKADYCHLIDYKKGVFHSEGFYHTICYVNRISGKDNPDRVMARGLMMQAAQVLNHAKKEIGMEN